MPNRFFARRRDVDRLERQRNLDQLFAIRQLLPPDDSIILVSADLSRPGAELSRSERYPELPVGGELEQELVALAGLYPFKEPTNGRTLSEDHFLAIDVGFYRLS